MVVFRPHVYKFRVFSDDQVYGDPYIGVGLVTWQGGDKVEIDLTHGELSRQDFLAICTTLRDMGVRTVAAWRADKKRLTCGRPVRTEGRFTLWEADLDRMIERLSQHKVV